MATEQAPSPGAVSTDGASASSETQSYYQRELHERERLARECPVDVYVSGINPRYGWPYRMANADKASPAVADACDVLMIDSMFRDPWYPIPDILDTAHRLDAGFVMTKDYWSWGERTFALNEIGYFLREHYATHECDAATVPVVTPDTSAGDLRALRSWVQGDGEWNIGAVAVGALRAESSDRQVATLKRAREALGDDVHIHGLGVGTDPTLISAVRASIDDVGPPLVDSLDTSTPENSVASNKIADKHWTQHRVPLPEGDDSTTVRALFSVAQAAMLAYELTPWCDEPITPVQQDVTQFDGGGE